jgi:hypothetical protein
MKRRVRKPKETPCGKLWGPLDSSGKRFGWVASDSPEALAAARRTVEEERPTEPSTAPSTSDVTESLVAGMEVSCWDAISDAISDSGSASTETSSAFSTGAAYQNPLMKTMRPPLVEEAEEAGSEESSWATGTEGGASESTDTGFL